MLIFFPGEFEHVRNVSGARRLGVFHAGLDRNVLTSYMTSQSRLGFGMKSWPVQDAKARFSELLDRCLAEGPQLVTKRGADAAVLVPVADWRRLSEAARPSLKDLLLAPEPRGDMPIPERGRSHRRAPVDLD